MIQMGAYTLLHRTAQRSAHQKQNERAPGSPLENKIADAESILREFSYHDFYIRDMIVPTDPGRDWSDSNPVLVADSKRSPSSSSYRTLGCSLLPKTQITAQRNAGGMNWESERDMAKDVEESHELYAALADESDDE